MKTIKIKNKTEVGGMWGEKIDVTKVNGRLVVANRPKRKVSAEPSEEQNAAKKRFLLAIAYAKDQVNIPETKAIYSTGISEKQTSAYIVALTDFLTAPEVDGIDTEEYSGTVGDIISIVASDDFQVVRARIVITDESGAKLEQAESAQIPAKAFRWNYKTTVANPTLAGTKIKVTAYDRAGNKGSLEKLLE